MGVFYSWSKSAKQWDISDLPQREPFLKSFSGIQLYALELTRLGWLALEMLPTLIAVRAFCFSSRLHAFGHFEFSKTAQSCKDSDATSCNDCMTSKNGGPVFIARNIMTLQQYTESLALCKKKGEDDFLFFRNSRCCGERVLSVLFIAVGSTHNDVVRASAFDRFDRSQPILRSSLSFFFTM